ncbi:MAG: ribosome biogenesis GTP-binding protein YihA/YsxC [Acidobacteriota bacterium]
MKLDNIEYAGTRPPRDGLPEVAVIGRSNAGKSTLINLLAGRAGLARVGKLPGKTRTLHFFRCGGRMYLVDFPGYGFSNVPESERVEWRELVRHYAQDRPTLLLGLLVVDARRPATPLDLQAAAWWRDLQKALFVVATKSDKLARAQIAALSGQLCCSYPAASDNCFVLSHRDRGAVDILRRALIKRLSCTSAAGKTPSHIH